MAASSKPPRTDPFTSFVLTNGSDAVDAPRIAGDFIVWQGQPKNDQFHHIYNGTVMVVLSLAASIGICLAGMRMKSRTFEAIGAIGGMISNKCK